MSEEPLEYYSETDIALPPKSARKGDLHETCRARIAALEEALRETWCVPYPSDPNEFQCIVCGQIGTARYLESFKHRPGCIISTLAEAQKGRKHE